MRDKRKLTPCEAEQLEERQAEIERRVHLIEVRLGIVFPQRIEEMDRHAKEA